MQQLALDFVKRLSGQSKKDVWFFKIRPTQRRASDSKSGQEENRNEASDNQRQSEASLKEHCQDQDCQLDPSMELKLFAHFSVSTVEINVKNLFSTQLAFRRYHSCVLLLSCTL